MFSYIGQGRQTRMSGLYQSVKFSKTVQTKHRTKAPEGQGCTFNLEMPAKDDTLGSLSTNEHLGASLQPLVAVQGPSVHEKNWNQTDDSHDVDAADNNKLQDIVYRNMSSQHN